MKQILASALTISLLALSGYMYFEPAGLSAAVAGDQIQITQVVTGEITISHPSDCAMDSSLGGVTGGTANCYAEWTITTTDSSGFNVALVATSSGDGPTDYVMAGNTQGDWIDNYTEGTYGVPDFTWAVSNAAEFGYTATTTTAADLPTTFKTTAGSAPCNAGSTVTDAACWITASSTARTVMNRSSEATSGTKLYINFRVQINNHNVVEDTYTATTTLTATTN